MTKMANRLKTESGQTIVEYALLIAYIALVLMPAVWYLSREMEKGFSRTASSISQPPPSTPPPPP